MARLYRYADSSDQSGYYLIGGSSNGNYTMGATLLGRRLFDRLEYDPGIRNRERGPRIPSQLQWAMYDVGLLTTGDKEPSGAGFDGELDVDDSGITEEMMAELEEFVLEEESQKEEVQELGEILGIDPEQESRKPIWEITEFEAQEIVSTFQSFIESSICTENYPDWNIDVRFKPDIPGLDGSTSFNVNIEHPTDEQEKYTYQIVYMSDETSDTSAVTTMTKANVDTNRRVRIDRQRGRVLEAMSIIPQLTGYYAGNPTQELSVIILEGVLD